MEAPAQNKMVKQEKRSKGELSEKQKQERCPHCRRRLKQEPDRKN